MKFRLSAIVFLIALLTCASFGQLLNQDLISKQRDRSMSTGASGARISLDDQLRQDLLKKRQEVEGLSELIPLEGAIDPDKYIIGPGDKFSVRLSGNLEENYVIPVGADGYLILPYTNSVYVAGMNLTDAKAAVAEQFKKVFCEDAYSVSMVGARIFKIHVTGMVALPGSYTATAADRIHSGIEYAGGKLSTADMSRVKVYRKGDTLDIDLGDYLYNGNIESNPYLEDGDVIFVPGPNVNEDGVFVMGAGELSGLIHLKENETLINLIDRIGSNREYVDYGNIDIVRNGEEFSRNLIEDEGSFELMNGDSIYIPIVNDSVYVGGRVVEGGAVQYIGSYDYKVYVALAGGVIKEGSWKRVKIIRNGEKMNPKKAGPIRRGDAIIVDTSPWFSVTEVTKSLGQIASFISVVYVIGFSD